METIMAAVYNARWRILLTNISSRQHSAISGRPLLELTDCGPAVCS